MDLLQIREKEIFDTLNVIKNCEFVVIGGYAVNAYTLPRFSVDCDIVIKGQRELQKIEKLLLQIGYVKVNARDEVPYSGKFQRYEKEIAKNFRVSMDVLIGSVLDRQSNAEFTFDWIFENSSVKALKGKTITEQLTLRIVDLDALFVMKLLCCRLTDIRDIFLLINSIKDKSWIRKEVSERYDFENRMLKVVKEVNSMQFKDSLQGVFGLVDEKVFERNKKLIQDL